MRKIQEIYLALKELNKNLYFALAWRLGWVMVLFTVCRIAFYVINRSYFPNTDLSGLLRLMGAGLVFDLSAVLYTNLPYLILFLLPWAYRNRPGFQSGMKWLFIVTNSLALLANCGDFIYFQFGFRRTTASIFTEFQNEDNLDELLPKFIVGYWYVVVIWVGLLAALMTMYGRVQEHGRRKGHVLVMKPLPLAKGMLVLAVLGLFVAGGLRGNFTFSGNSISIRSAGKYISEPLEANIVLNTPFAIYTTIGKEYFEREEYFTSGEELARVFNPVHTPKPAGEFKPENVVILILESFGAEYTRSYGKHLDGGRYKGYTPFLDSLIGEGLMYTHSFSNGRKSVDAVPSVLASIPMIEEPLLVTKAAKNDFNSIASLLNGKGYHTAFFHGAPNGSLGFQEFTKAVGFKEYYGMDDYPHKEHFDGSWGIWDEEFFQYFAGKMNQFREPFCTAIFSVSSHHPFQVPERYKGKLQKGPVPILQCINYTDMALRKFFQTASTMPWYKNTLFVITGDHTSQSSYLEYKTNIGAFKVPVVFFKPDGSLKGQVDDLAQQIDIMPTVLGYLNYDKPFFAFGRNLFDPAQEPFVITYTTNTYQLLMGHYLYLFNGLTQTGLYNIDQDILLSRNLAGQNPELEHKMELKVKAFVQQYNNRMVENRLLPDR